mmetsp:Transcript_72663/g.144355  ORF Transcript_72663/g.144355 Transcript_72663/m.144355 type:complete len:82 (+) Transcript_72663:204-449(+)
MIYVSRPLQFEWAGLSGGARHNANNASVSQAPQYKVAALAALNGQCGMLMTAEMQQRPAWSMTHLPTFLGAGRRGEADSFE